MTSTAKFKRQLRDHFNKTVNDKATLNRVADVIKYKEVSPMGERYYIKGIETGKKFFWTPGKSEECYNRMVGWFTENGPEGLEFSDNFREYISRTTPPFYCTHCNKPITDYDDFDGLRKAAVKHIMSAECGGGPMAAVMPI